MKDSHFMVLQFEWKENGLHQNIFVPFHRVEKCLGPEEVTGGRGGGAG